MGTTAGVTELTFQIGVCSEGGQQCPPLTILAGGPKRMMVVDKSLETLDLFGFKTIGFKEAYSENHREYHGLSHMEFMLTRIDEIALMFGLEQDEYLNLILATWYHDFVYVPGARDNEYASAVLAYKTLGEASPVPEMVLKTRDHMEPETFLDGCLLDADLCGLGYPWEIYKQNSLAIRNEYKVTDEQWKEGRSYFLDKRLARPTIFFTAWGGRFERFARSNMNRELFLLTGIDGMDLSSARA